MNPNGESFKSILNLRYGTRALYLFNRQRDIASKLAHLHNDCIYLRKCCKEHLISPGFVLHNAVGPSALRLLSQTSRRLQRSALNDKFIKANFLLRQFRSLQRESVYILSEPIKTDFYRLIFATYDRVFDATKVRQLNKLKNLRQMQSSQCSRRLWPDITFRDSLIVNDTSIQFSDVEKDILALGPKFIPFPRKNLIPDFVSAVQLGLNFTKDVSLSKRSNDIVRNCASIIAANKSKPTIDNLSSQHRAAFYNLVKRSRAENFLIISADKGSKTVILNKEDYNTKIMAHLEDARTYELQRKNANPVTKVHSLIKPILDECLSKGEIEKSFASKLLPSVQTSKVPVPYGLAKIHKPNCPLRLIIPMIGSVQYNIGKFCANILKPAVEDIKHRISKPIEVLTKLRCENYSRDLQICSFDVVALFPSVNNNTLLMLLPDILNNTQDRWREKVSGAQNISIASLLLLFEVLLNSTLFRFGSKVYKQLTGVPMGSPVSVALAEIYMQYVYTILESRIPIHLKPVLFERYIDDFLAVFEAGASIKSFLDILNSLDPTGVLCFTLELEVNGSLPFLDILITKGPDGFIFSVYRKSTHSNRYLHPSSLLPKSVAKCIAKGMRLRALNYCDDNNLPEELQFISNVFESHGYDRRFIHNNILTPTFGPPRAKPKFSDFSAVVVLPYLQPYFQPLKQYLAKEGILVVFRSLPPIRSNLYYKYAIPSPGSILESHNVVYKLDCDVCDLFYIGMTTRKLRHRLDEHASDFRHPARSANDNQFSAMARHAIDRGHNFGSSISVISTSSNSEILRVRESLFIEFNKQAVVNSDSSSTFASKYWSSLAGEFKLS